MRKFFTLIVACLTIVIYLKSGKAICGDSLTYGYRPHVILHPLADKVVKDPDWVHLGRAGSLDGKTLPSAVYIPVDMIQFIVDDPGLECLTLGKEL